MTQQVTYKIGETVYIPPYSSKYAVVIKVGKKYATLVMKSFHGTESEKDMSFKVDILTNTVTGRYPAPVYQSKEQHEQVLGAALELKNKQTRIKETKWEQLSGEQLDQILKIIDGQ